MSEVKVNKISPRSGTTVTLGDSGDTFTVPSGATFDASNATTTLPSTVVTTTGTQTLTNKTIDASQLSGTITPSDATVTPAKLNYNYNQYRNIIINGDMSIAQRSTSVAGITSFGYYTVDRMRLFGSYIGTWTQSQSTDVPASQGFAKSLKMDCTASSALSASTSMTIATRFEGQMLQYLKKGTASAESLTLSFWVKSNKTGTYIAELYDTDNARSISKSYSIDVADTWEKKTITFAGDTTGAFNNDNNTSLELNLWIGAGTDFTSGTSQTSWGTLTNANRAYGQTVNLADSTSNYINITGVQLEAGTTASDFEFLPYDVNLGRCMRYYEKLIMSNIAAVGYSNSASNAITVMTSSYIKRTSPSLTIPPAGSGAGEISFLTNAGAYPSTFGSIAVFDTNITSFSLNQTGMTGAYSGAGLAVALYGADGESIKIDAEL